jgi:biopolymer transport protein ExbB
LVCSVIGLALIIERLVSLQTIHITPPKLLEQALMFSRQSLPSPQVLSQLEQNSLLGEVLASGFRAIHTNPRCSEQDLRSSMEAAGRLVARKLENNLATLATIASSAPLLGLLGTVVGMIEIFGAQTPAVGAAAATINANPAMLAHGISVALYNTAFGLMVAIPTLMCWRYFRARVDQHLLDLEIASERLMRHLNTLRAS